MPASKAHAAGTDVRIDQGRPDRKTKALEQARQGGPKAADPNGG
jgi:hypothetical protein